MNEPIRKPVIKASEVAQFCYCSVAWHLQKKGYKPESQALDVGIEAHKNLGTRIETISKRERRTNWLQWVGVGVLLLAFFSPFITFAIGRFSGTTSVVFYTLLIVAVVIISISRYRYRRIRRSKAELGIPKGKIIYTDLDKPAEPLFSKNLWLTGKPDYIVKSGLEYIPVEAKTTVADEPYRGHLMQMASYCLLLEDKYGPTIPYGVIVYGDGRQFKIPFTIELRKGIIDTLEEMRRQLLTASVAREHTSVAKCGSCSLRKFCTQKIEG